MTAINSEISDYAYELGFDDIGFSDARLPLGKGIELERFIAEKRHGDMSWLSRRAFERSQPKNLWPLAKTVIILAANYAPAVTPLSALRQKTKGNISVYARFTDYHRLLSKRLKLLSRKISSRYGARVRIFVDSSPVMEKPLASLSGIGWQGKHTNLVSRKYGSWLFLGGIMTDIELLSSQKVPREGIYAEFREHKDYCGSCNRCIEICPTKAITAPYRLDARRCISYLTIEHKGHIPRPYRQAIGNRIFGCDDCLAVCPWNKFARAPKEFIPYGNEDMFDLRFLAGLSDEEFTKLFRFTAIKRCGRDRFVRNVMIGIGNSADLSLLDRVYEALSDSSSLVRAMAVWALSRLAEGAEIQSAYNFYAGAEKDEYVCLEWFNARQENQPQGKVFREN